MSLLSDGAGVASVPALRGERLIEALELANLVGRGGAGFPVARKWRTVRANGHGRAVVLVNGAEGEPLSRKDRTLMSQRPDLVIDGALLAAEAVGAPDIIFYVGSEHRSALGAMRRALAERSQHTSPRCRIVEAPVGYVSGEESAAVHYLNAGDARPTVTPPRPFERGVGGRATLVQNVESLAVAAELAAGDSRGTALVTASGAVRRHGVFELPDRAATQDVAGAAGGLSTDVQAVLIGGYFGSWASADEVWSLRLERPSLHARGLSFGCGVFHFLPSHSCGVDATARIIGYLASQSARQCGPCVFGLSAIAAAMRRLAERAPHADDLARVTRWSGMVAGRGACKHPDGATGLLRSALDVFEGDFAAHQHRHCTVAVPAQRRERVLAEAVA